jgi:Pro-kumamolisin, activation domain
MTNATGKSRRALCRGVLSLSMVTVGLIGVASTAGASTYVRPHALSPTAAPRGSVAEGAVPPSQDISLRFVLAPSHAAQLSSLLQSLYDTSSPDYHHWLTPSEFDADFGPSASVISSVKSWLRSKGLVGTMSGFSFDVTARSSQVASALATKFVRYRAVGGHTGYDAKDTPLVPAALAGGEIASILGLNTVVGDQSQVHLAASGPVHANDSASRPLVDGLTPCAQASAIAQAEPGDLTLDADGAEYGMNALLSDGQRGQGKTIGVYELAPYSPSDVSAYENCFGLTNPVSRVSVDGGASNVTNGTIEADLDVEQAATQSPDASIISYEGPDDTQGQYDTWNAIVSQDQAQVISSSWGVCEPIAQGDGTLSAFTALFEQAASQGQTILAASGDSGSEDCYNTDEETSEQVDYPGSDPWVTDVGGTTINSPGQEVVWNDCQTNEGISCASEHVGASGSGMSRSESRPSFEPSFLTWPVVQACGTSCRELPDISASAGNPVAIYSGGEWHTVTGTSVAAPLMAGMVADRDVGCTTPTGLFASSLFALYDQGAYGTAFTDITSGDTDLTGTNGGAFAAGSGYDLASGIGTPIAGGLSCPEVTSVGAGGPGSDVTVSGLGLEHASIDFGRTPAQVVSSSATQAVVVVPDGSGTVTVSATSVLGSGTQTVNYAYGGSGGGGGGGGTNSSSGHGYWLVGSDGGIFSFGSAGFHGSTGSLKLQRPVVGITPTQDDGGYWLVASDGGIFSFGDSTFYGSIPKLGIAPAGTPGTTNRLNAPIVGMVPSADGGGYFMVASDGGVFAFGDAAYAGSCVSIGGCSGSAVAVMPDATGDGYWLVTATGHVYTFGDATYDGAPNGVPSPVTSAIRTPDGGGYWILLANGTVDAFGDAANLGGATGAVGGSNPATAIFATADGGGYWIASANGAITTFGDAPNDGGMAGSHLNDRIIAGTGW